METTKNFKKVSKLVKTICIAKDEARKIIDDINKERLELDALETDAKSILKL